MRKVQLTMNEEQKYLVIKKLVETSGNKKNAALKIGCTQRHINRMIIGYKNEGKSFFIHGNKGRTPARTIPASIRQNVLDLYRNKYYDTNFSHFSELLQSEEGISLSISSITSILEKEFILSPKATRAKKRRTKQFLKHMKTVTKSNKKLADIQSNIIAIEDSHSRRPRCAFFGEMLQMGASVHEWFGNTKTHLHITVDDATGSILGAYFDTQETLKGYYNIFHQVLTCYGIPYNYG